MDVNGKGSEIMNQEIKVSISELLYYIFFSILFFAKAIGLYDGQLIFKCCLVTAFVFVFAKIILTSYSFAQAAMTAFLVLLGIVIYRNSGEKSALIFLVTMIGFKNISMERLVKVGLWIWGTGFGLLVVKSLLVPRSDYVMADDKFGITVLRRGLGYSHPNVLHVSYAILVVLILLSIKNEKKRQSAYLWAFVGNFIVYLYSASNTGFMLVLMFLVLNIYFSRRKTYSILEKIMIILVFPACVIFSLLAPLLVDPDSKLASLMNKLLNNRFYASRLYMQENPLTLFGQRIYASHTYALDNSYVTLFIYGGLVLFVLVCAGYLYAIWTSLKKQDSTSLSILLSFVIAGVIEPFLFNLSFKNISLLVIAGVLFAGKDKTQLRLLYRWDKELTIKRKPENGKNIQCKKERIVLLSMAAGLVLAGSYLVFSNAPDRVLVDEKYCFVEGEALQLDEQKFSDNEQVVFYQCTDATKSIYSFEGMPIRFWMIRNAVSIFYLSLLTGTLIAGKWPHKIVREG